MIINENDPELFDKVSTVLEKEGIVIMASDTIYGFFGVAPETRERIAKVKGRDEGKGFIMLISDLSWIEMFGVGEIPESLLTYWPGPLTIIVKGIVEKTVAFRMPDNSFLINLMKRLNKPLYSTSVNKSGEKPMNNIEEIIKKYSDSVDLIVNSGRLENTLPSTVIDISGSYPVLIRQGALQIDIGQLGKR